MALELERPQPEQQLKPAMNPLLQGIFNLLGGGLEGALPNDPVIENLVQAGGTRPCIISRRADFIYELFHADNRSV